ncbi:hypothetical protein DUNSADRAFT_6905 [Dunaliella salina]|uniref:Sulfotransferase n=1 Tax=Dunaliella salina TaxID=3046 RepID=A0ABQ7GMF1_DUNSA|nr:hypothetical protein DUNSADRAFT_6905 [Dunaliella salina]|eukprot:KAF5835765.1 hypothetical protein DUNSADRAFT_6905 [Dunaliella salina]
MGLGLRQGAKATLLHLLCLILSDLGLSTCPTLLKRAPHPHALRAWGNMCVISRQHSFVWIPIPKTGSSSVRNLLTRSLCCSPDKMNSPACGPQSQPIFFQQVCPPQVLRTVNCATIFSGQVFQGMEKNASSFFFFSVARSPWVRALSSWNYGRLCYANWVRDQKSEQAFPPYPALDAALGSSPGYEVLPAPFLKWFETVHLGPQAFFLIDQTGLPAVDMILRTEHLHADFLCLFRLLGITTSFVKVGNLRHFPMAHCEHLEHTRSIASYYEADFALLSSLGAGYSQVQCDQSSEALILPAGCNCTGSHYCICRKPGTLVLRCDKLACSRDYTNNPCRPQLCSEQGSALEVPLPLFKQ